MAGNPLRRRVRDALAARAIAQLGDDATALDYACDFIASGGTIAALAESLGAEMGTSVSRPLVSALLNDFAADAPARLATARQDCASALVEEGKAIADAVAEDAAAVAKARLQVGTRQWLAERLAPESFGAKAPSVQVNIGALMLDALRQPPPPPPFATIAAPAAALRAAEETVDFAIAS